MPASLEHAELKSDIGHSQALQICRRNQLSLNGRLLGTARLKLQQSEAALLSAKLARFILLQKHVELAGGMADCCGAYMSSWLPGLLAIAQSVTSSWLSQGSKGPGVPRVRAEISWLPVVYSADA